MDITLTNNAANFIDEVRECVENYGYDVFDWSNGLYELIGSFTTVAVNNWMARYHDEIEAVIAFAGMWAVDLSEWDLEDPFDRLKFAAQYIAMELQSDAEYNAA